jgi:hypothetical protein
VQYSAPTPADLRRLKESMDVTGQQMAELFGLGGDHQWRKYTGGQAPREMSAQMLFFGVARMALDAATLERVVERMRACGAEIDLNGWGAGSAARANCESLQSGISES